MKQANRFVHLDGLRGVAILLVVLFHFYPVFFPLGYLGVDVFFVLSGYLIGFVYLNKFNCGFKSAKEFLNSRLHRLFPAYLIVLSASSLYGVLFLSFFDLDSFLKSALSSFVFYSNFIFQNQIGYFDVNSDFKPLLHLWSLSVEFQFYSLFAILLYFRSKLNLNYVLFLLLTVSFAFYFFYEGLRFFMLLPRLWEFIFGILLFVNYKYICSVVGKFNLFVINVFDIFILIILSIIFFNPGLISNDLILKVIIVVSVCWFIIDVKSQGRVSFYFLRLMPVLFFGSISYVLYLIHWPVLSFVRIHFGGDPEFYLRSIILICTVFISYVIWYFFDQVYSRKKFSSMFLFRFWFFGVVFIGIILFFNKFYIYPISVNNQSSDIVRNPYPLPYGFTKSPCDDSMELDFECFVYNRKSSINTSVSSNTLIIGDSHSYAFVGEESLKHLGSSITFIKKSSCFPSANDLLFHSDSCASARRQLVAYLSDRQYSDVVLSGYWLYLSSGSFSRSGFNWRLADIPNSSELGQMFFNLNEIINIFPASTKIHVFGQVPELGFNIHSCYSSSIYNRLFVHNARCESDFSVVQSRASRLNVSFSELRDLKKNLYFYDPARSLCDIESCFVFLDDTPLYFDGDHLNSIGGAVIFSDFLKLIRSD